MIRTLLILGDQEGDRAKAAIKRGWMGDPNPKDVFPFLQVQRGRRGEVRVLVRHPFEDGKGTRVGLIPQDSTLTFRVLGN